MRYFFSGGVAGAAAGCGAVLAAGDLGISAAFGWAGGALTLGAVPDVEPRRSKAGGLSGAGAGRGWTPGAVAGGGVGAGIGNAPGPPLLSGAGGEPAGGVVAPGPLLSCAAEVPANSNESAAVAIKLPMRKVVDMAKGPCSRDAAEERGRSGESSESI